MEARERPGRSRWTTPPRRCVRELDRPAARSSTTGPEMYFNAGRRASPNIIRLSSATARNWASPFSHDRRETGTPITRGRFVWRASDPGAPFISSSQPATLPELLARPLTGRARPELTGGDKAVFLDVLQASGTSAPTLVTAVGAAEQPMGPARGQAPVRHGTPRSPTRFFLGVCQASAQLRGDDRLRPTMLCQPVGAWIRSPRCFERRLHPIFATARRGPARSAAWALE